MRRSLESLVSLLLVYACVLSAFGEPVDLDVAAKLGETHLRSEEQSWRGGSAALQSSAVVGKGYSVSEVRELRANGRLLAYVLDLEPAGCIIVSADTDVHPVIAYSLEGRFSMVDTSENIFLHLVKWDMQNRLDALPVIPLGLKEENNALWERYLSEEDGASIQAVTASQVWGPWLETTWCQGVAYRQQGYIYPDYSYGDYNRYCPIGHSSEWRSITGCGPVAMAQIVNYWEYPSSLSLDQSDSYTSSTSYSINGTPYNLTVDIDADNVTYDFPDFTKLNSKLSAIRYYDGDLYYWDAQLWDYRSPVDEDPDLNAAAKQEIKEDIAALCFACGILFRAKYSPVGTSAFVSYSPGSTMNFSPFMDSLGYSSAIVADIAWPQFYTSLEANMRDAQPAMILVDSQSNSQSHFIVADGYRDEWQGGSAGYYHLNFGWGNSNPDGVDDSWYHLPEGMPQPDGLQQYSVVKLGIIDIYPPPQENTPPVASNLNIDPSSPGPGDDLVASYDYYDADGDLQSGSEIRWYRNSAEQVAYYGLDTVSSADISVEDVWYFTVRPSDWEDFGDTKTSSSVIIENQVMQMDIQLYSDWNFISICLDIADTDLLSVLDQIKDSCISVHYYDTASGQWKRYFFNGPQFLNDLDTIEPGKGYWLNMAGSAVLTITGPQIMDTAVQLFPGRNLVGYSLVVIKSCAEALSTIDGDYVVIWAYDNETGTWSKYAPAAPDASNTLTQLEPGKAYCIEAIIGCIWDVSP